MKENIVKNGARVISFAPDDESTNILGTVTSNYEFNGTTHYYKGQLVLDIEYDAYWASCWFDTSAGIREHTGINLSEVYEDTEPEYFNK